MQEVQERKVTERRTQRDSPNNAFYCQQRKCTIPEQKNEIVARISFQCGYCKERCDGPVKGGAVPDRRTISRWRK